MGNLLPTRVSKTKAHYLPDMGRKVLGNRNIRDGDDMGEDDQEGVRLIARANQSHDSMDAARKRKMKPKQKVKSSLFSDAQKLGTLSFGRNTTTSNNNKRAEEVAQMVSSSRGYSPVVKRTPRKSDSRDKVAIDIPKAGTPTSNYVTRSRFIPSVGKSATVNASPSSFIKKKPASHMEVEEDCDDNESITPKSRRSNKLLPKSTLSVPKKVENAHTNQSNGQRLTKTTPKMTRPKVKKRKSRYISSSSDNDDFEYTARPSTKRQCKLYSQRDYDEATHGFKKAAPASDEVVTIEDSDENDDVPEVVADAPAATVDKILSEDEWSFTGDEDACVQFGTQRPRRLSKRESSKFSGPDGVVLVVEPSGRNRDPATTTIDRSCILGVDLYVDEINMLADVVLRCRAEAWMAFDTDQTLWATSLAKACKELRPVMEVTLTRVSYSKMVRLSGGAGAGEVLRKWMSEWVGPCHKVTKRCIIRNKPLKRSHRRSRHARSCDIVPSPVVLAYKGSERIEITDHDVKRLEEGEFLNDIMIMFYLRYVSDRKFSIKQREAIHIFDTYFYECYTDATSHKVAGPESYSRVKKWTKKTDIFEKDFIVIPINEHAHWYVAIVCFAGDMVKQFRVQSAGEAAREVLSKSQQLETANQTVGEVAREAAREALSESQQSVAGTKTASPSRTGRGGVQKKAAAYPRDHASEDGATSPPAEKQPLHSERDAQASTRGYGNGDEPTTSAGSTRHGGGGSGGPESDEAIAMESGDASPSHAETGTVVHVEQAACGVSTLRRRNQEGGGGGDDLAEAGPGTSDTPVDTREGSASDNDKGKGIMDIESVQPQATTTTTTTTTDNNANTANDANVNSKACLFFTEEHSSAIMTQSLAPPPPIASRRPPPVNGPGAPLDLDATAAVADTRDVRPPPPASAGAESGGVASEIEKEADAEPLRHTRTVKITGTDKDTDKDHDIKGKATVARKPQPRPPLAPARQEKEPVLVNNNTSDVEEIIEDAGVKKKYENRREPMMIVFDSLGKHHRNTVKNIQQYLSQEASDKQGLPLSFENLAVRKVNLLEQNNHCDCGLFLLQYVESFFAGGCPHLWRFARTTQKNKSVNLTHMFDPETVNNKRHSIRRLIEDLVKEED